MLILTKPLGVGILTTAAKADMVSSDLLKKLYSQMACLNKTARDIMVKYEVHSCTDVTGFSLMGHGYEMASGSDASIHIKVDDVLYHKEAYEMADMGFIPAGAYRNRDYAEDHVTCKKEIARPMLDILFDPQTSGGLLISVTQKDAAKLLGELRDSMDGVSVVGYVTEPMESELILE